MKPVIVARMSNKIKQQIPMHLMLLPCIIILLVFSYYPMVGVIIAFEKYNPTKGFFYSQFVGLKNFIYIYNLPDTFQVLWNTVYISFMKIVAGIAVPVFFALLLDLVRRNRVKRTIQTIIYIPYFLSLA